MRRDLNISDSKELARFEFPILVPEVEIPAKGKHPRTNPEE
jgi:hypothetical protein